MSEREGAPHGLKIQMILDASAICAFGSNPAVGEIIGEIDSEGHDFATTTAALTEAIARGADRALIGILEANSACTVTGSALNWIKLGRFMSLTRPNPTDLHDLADSDLTLLALTTGAYILTDRPDRYTKIMSTVVTIELEDPWTD